MVNPDRNLYDPPYDDALLYDNEMEPERPRSRSLIVMLAFVVLAAFAGVVWVAYNQGVQQGQRGGNPPLLSADVGPSRVEPDSSGVSTAANPAPEKSYERLWAQNGEQSGSQETVMPGAEQPRSVPTTQEIAAAPVPGQPKAVDSATGKGGPLETKIHDPGLDSTVEALDQVPAETAPSTEFTAPSLAQKPRAPRGREDITSIIPGSDSMDTPVPPAAPPSVSRPSVTQTQPSAPRPIAPAAPINAPVQAAPEPTQLQSTEAPSEPAAAPASGGKASIQLGSFPSSKLAADQWTKVKGANQELLGAYSPQIVEATIPGKGVWYRLRVGGFSDKSAAKAVCDQLSASGQACMIAGK